MHISQETVVWLIRLRRMRDGAGLRQVPELPATETQRSIETLPAGTTDGPPLPAGHRGAEPEETACQPLVPAPGDGEASGVWSLPNHP